MNKYFAAILLALTATTTFANQNAINIVKSTIKSSLKDPDSATFKDMKVVTNSKGEQSICGSYNAKNSYGGYVGYKGFSADVKTGTIKSLEGLDDYVLNGCSGRAAELNLLQEKKNQYKLYEGNTGNFRQQTKEEELAKTNAIELWKVDVVNLAMKNWEKPSSTDNEISTEIAVMVDNTGKLLNLSWVKRTNNKTVDRSIVNAFKKTKFFKAPPTPMPTFTVVVSFPPQAVKTSEQ